MKNIELKAKCENIAKAGHLAVEIGAKFQWAKKQVDTYFNVSRGRLKLRQADGQAPELIGYFRENKAESRESNYSILPVADAKRVKNMLTNKLGILVIVTKIRKLYLFENVRIHLDQVEKLGDFLEFEGVLSDDSEIGLTKKRVNWMMEQFGIEKYHLVRYSYSDLLIEAIK